MTLFNVFSPTPPTSSPSSKRSLGLSNLAFHAVSDLQSHIISILSLRPHQQKKHLSFLAVQTNQRGPEREQCTSEEILSSPTGSVSQCAA